MSQKKYIDEKCPECKLGTMQIPANAQKWHVVCNECDAIMLVYEPLPHQAIFHADPHKYKMFAGGYGSGKTTTACMETIDHILETPGGATLIGAATLPQLEATAMKEFFEVFPEELIESYSKQKHTLVTKNGHTVFFRPLDDEQKARSLNLTFFWIEEGNGVDFSYFVQLQTRLRNGAADFQRGIISTNPDMNWIKTEFLLKSHKIYNSKITYYRNPDEVNRNFAVHIAPTDLNIHLPATYFDDTAAGKPEWWVKRYLLGSFENKEGLVYPQWEDNLVDDFLVPLHWPRRYGGDFGLNNATAFVEIASDPETGISYIVWEHKESHKPVKHHSEVLNEQIAGLGYNIIKSMVGDAAGQQKSHGDMSSTFDHYAEYGIYWTPSTKKLQDSIMKLYGYLDMEKLKIFKSCVNVIEEIQQYRYPERSIDKAVKNEDIYEKPIAKDDHLLDAIRYTIHEMPDDPDDLINKSYAASYTFTNTLGRKQNHLPHALQDNPSSSYSRKDSWVGY